MVLAKGLRGRGEEPVAGSLVVKSPDAASKRDIEKTIHLQGDSCQMYLLLSSVRIEHNLVRACGELAEGCGASTLGGEKWWGEQGDVGGQSLVCARVEWVRGNECWLGGETCSLRTHTPCWPLKWGRGCKRQWAVGR